MWPEKVKKQEREPNFVENSCFMKSLKKYIWPNIAYLKKLDYLDNTKA